METDITLTIPDNNKQIIEAFSKQPMKFCKHISNTTFSIKDAVMKGQVQLSELNRECPTVLMSVIARHIEGMLLYFGFETRDTNTSVVKDEVIKTLIEDIIHKYFYFRIEDVVMCFKRARQQPSLYGKFYGKLDASVVMNWFSVYDKERDEVIHELPKQPSQTQTNSTNEEVCSREEYVEMLLAMVAGGDLYANEKLKKVGLLESILNSNAVGYGNYKYNRKHKFDNKYKS